MIGTYPTPIERVSALSTPTTQLWVKRDDLTGDLYGGNKVRKLERILEEAKRRGAERLVTFGGAGSHHVLATTIYGVRAGFRVAAVLTPQHHTPHAQLALSTALSWGLEPWPAPHIVAVPFVLAARIRSGDYLVAPGGSSLLGTLGYVDAARELAGQIALGVMPVPDLVVTALGSGGTAAGLLAGLACDRTLGTRILAVRVVSRFLAGARRTVRLAEQATRYLRSPVDKAALAERLEVEARYFGHGYGWPTPEGNAATQAAASCGLVLDPTYTAKTFAAALDRVRAGGARHILYWHTLSRAAGSPPPGFAMLRPLSAGVDRYRWLFR